MDAIARHATARPTLCALCSCRWTGGDARSLTWSSHHSDGVVRWVCGPCTRAQLFEIETGLPLAPAVSLAVSA